MTPAHDEHVVTVGGAFYLESVFVATLADELGEAMDRAIPQGISPRAALRGLRSLRTGAAHRRVMARVLARLAATPPLDPKDVAAQGLRRVAVFPAQLDKPTA